MGFWRNSVFGTLGGLLSCLYPFLALLLLKRFYAYIPNHAALALKLYPVAVNGVLLGVFSLSLARGPSAIERFARLQEPNLSPRGVDYARSVTKVWCVFFIANGLTALATALWASDGAWALYNGFIAYLFMGALMGVELIVRRRARSHDAA